MNIVSNINLNLDTKNDQTEENTILLSNNSCFEDQSFFKSLSNTKITKKEETEFSKYSKELVSSIHKNKPKINDYIQNFENILNAQSLTPNSSKQNNRKIIKEFIERNNIVKNNKIEEKKEKENEKNKEETKIDEIQKKKSKNNAFNEIAFQEFIFRQKKLLLKSHKMKEEGLKKKDYELLRNIQEKPTINKKSLLYAAKRNKNNNKVQQRLYQIPNNLAFSVDNKNKSKKNYYNIKANTNNKNEKKNNINSTESENTNNNIKKKKFNFRKKSKNNIKSFSSNNFYKKESDEKSEINNSINEQTPKKNKKNIFLIKNNSGNNIKYNYKIKSKIIDYNNRTSKSSNKMKPKLNKYEGDKLFNEYNSQSAKDKMKIFQINKIDEMINNLLPRNAQEYGINFFLFCELLFNLGFVYALHKNKNNNEFTDEYIQEIIIQPYIKRSIITKDFIYNEILIIKDAFTSIINHFQIKKILDLSVINNENSKENLLSKKNDTITIEDFKLFIFIISDIFDGNHKDKKINSPRQSIDDSKLKNISYNTNAYSNKTNKSINKIKHNNKIHKILSKILPNITLEDFDYKDIINYKIHFKYMMKINNEYIIYYENEKKKLKKDQELKSVLEKFTYFPKTNDNTDLILNALKPNMDYEERNKIIALKNKRNKSKIAKEINDEFSERCSFNPHIKGKRGLKNIFEKADKLAEIENKKKEEKEEKKKAKKERDLNNNMNHINDMKDMNNIENNNNQNINKNNKKFKNSMLLKNDTLVKERIKQMRNINFSKKVNYFEKNNREILLSPELKKNKKFLNHLLNNADEGRMILGLEKKSNKDNFDIFKKGKQNQKNNNEQNGYLSNVIKIINEKDLNKLSVFILEININDENNILEVHPNDNYEELCSNFCQEHNLGIESYNYILDLIKKKLDEIDGYNF